MRLVQVHKASFPLCPSYLVRYHLLLRLASPYPQPYPAAHLIPELPLHFYILYRHLFLFDLQCSIVKWFLSFNSRDIYQWCLNSPIVHYSRPSQKAQHVVQSGVWLLTSPQKGFFSKKVERIQKLKTSVNNLCFVQSMCWRPSSCWGFPVCGFTNWFVKREDLSAWVDLPRYMANNTPGRLAFRKWRFHRQIISPGPLGLRKKKGRKENRIFTALYIKIFL